MTGHYLNYFDKMTTWRKQSLASLIKNLNKKEL